MTLISGSRGLAESLITTFHRSEHRISVLARRPEAAREVEARFPGVTTFVGDLAEPGTARRWVEHAARSLGGVDCLVNNAAVPGPGGRLHETSFEDFARAVQVNLLAQVEAIHAALPHLMERRGVVINLSGGGATYPRPRFAAYATTKCALVRLTETLAGEYPELRFYAISPGALATPMMEAIARMDPRKVGPEIAEAKRRLEQGAEDPAKAARLVAWLVDERPERLNGRLVSAVWDDYRNERMPPSEVGWWTLRRVDEVCRKNLTSGS